MNGAHRLLCIGGHATGSPCHRNAFLLFRTSLFSVHQQPMIPRNTDLGKPHETFPPPSSRIGRFLSLHTYLPPFYIDNISKKQLLVKKVHATGIFMFLWNTLQITAFSTRKATNPSRNRQPQTKKSRRRFSFASAAFSVSVCFNPSDKSCTPYVPSPGAGSWRLRRCPPPA